MPCKSCLSKNQREFPAEVNIHFPGKEGLKKPTVWAFPRLGICLDCGLTQFTLGDSELMQLNDPDSHTTIKRIAS